MKRFVSILALLLVSTASGLAAEPRVATLEWTKVETPHLRLYSSVRDSKTREVARGLELLRGALETIFPPLTGPGGSVEDPVTVVLFESERHYRPYREAFAPEGATVRGHLVSHPLGDFVAIDSYPREGAWSQPLAFHEMTHAYLANRYPAIPAWLHEGLAEYFSTFQEIGGRIQIGVPHPQHVLHLRRSRFLPWGEILGASETPRDDVDDRFYSQSWLLVHCLRHRDGADPTAVRRYLEALASGSHAGTAFREIFHLDPGGLETPVRAYLNRPRFEMADLAAPAVAPIAIRPAATSEVLYRLGLSLALGGGAEELAREHFEAARTRGEPDAAAGLAYLLENEDPEAAEAAYAAALAAGADDPLTFHLYGLWLVRRLRGEVPGGAPDLEHAREILERAVALSPGDPRPRALLGTTWLFGDGPVDEGIGHLLLAHRAQPGNATVLFNLAMLYLRAGQVARAEEIVEGPLGASGSGLADRAKAELERKALEVAVNDALRSGHTEEARRRIEEARAGADPLRAEELDRWLARVEDQARRAKETAVYNEAVTYANFGEWQEVVRRLRPLVADGTTPDVVAAARKLLEEAERKME